MAAFQSSHRTTIRLWLSYSNVSYFNCSSIHSTGGPSVDLHASCRRLNEWPLTPDRSHQLLFQLPVCAEALQIIQCVFSRPALHELRLTGTERRVLKNRLLSSHSIVSCGKPLQTSPRTGFASALHVSNCGISKAPHANSHLPLTPVRSAFVPSPPDSLKDSVGRSLACLRGSTKVTPVGPTRFQPQRPQRPRRSPITAFSRTSIETRMPAAGTQPAGSHCRSEEAQSLGPSPTRSPRAQPYLMRGNDQRGCSHDLVSGGSG